MVNLRGWRLCQWRDINLRINSKSCERFSAASRLGASASSTQSESREFLFFFFFAS
jgi:hypothetical protein